MARIGVFDSGVGGLTVLAALLNAAPHVDYVYVGDTARVPYGSKSPETVTRYALELAAFLDGRGVDQMVAACNTVSSVALPALRARFQQPLFDVIRPAVTEALRIGHGGPVGVIGTRSTVASGAYQAVAAELLPGIGVLSVACPLFVPLVEEGMQAHPAALSIARTYLEPLARGGIDTLILGCTHYPLMASVIQDAMGPGVSLVTSSDTVAAEVSHTIDAAGGRPGKLELWATDDPGKMRSFAQRIVGPDVPEVGFLTLPSA